MLDKSSVVDLVKSQMWPAFKAERDRLDRIDKWYRFDHDRPHNPRQATEEYKQLADRSQTPILGLVVTSVAQTLYVDGYRQADSPDDAAPWGDWQSNGMDRRQIAIHRAALAYGLAYTTVLPGEDMFGAPMPKIRGVSPRRMIAFYAEPADDDWPMFALQATPARIKGSLGWSLKVFDDQAVWTLQCAAGGDDLTYITYDEHRLGVCPVVRYANMLDLEGRADGEVEPFIPIAGRIDQTVFDRLVVQRFSSWVVRTVAGMSVSETASATGLTPEQVLLKLKVGDLLTADNPETKFGSLPASPLDGFIASQECDVRLLAAVSQTPAHELLGQLANLSAEALAAARASLTAKKEERQYSFGESHEQTLRLTAWVRGDEANARDMSAQVRWRDTEIRSLSQAADALGKLAQMLGVPVEMLWEKIPGFTQQDVERAKSLVSQGGSIADLMTLLDRQAQQPAVTAA